MLKFIRPIFLGTIFVLPRISSTIVQTKRHATSLIKFSCVKQKKPEQKFPHITKSDNGTNILMTKQKIYTNEGSVNVDLREHHDWFHAGGKKIRYTYRVVDGELAVLKNVDTTYSASKLLEKEIIKCLMNPESQNDFAEYIEKNYGLLVTEMFPELD